MENTTLFKTLDEIRYINISLLKSMSLNEKVKTLIKDDEPVDYYFYTWTGTYVGETDSTLLYESLDFKNIHECIGSYKSAKKYLGMK